jgi:hypothetical protein
MRGDGEVIILGDVKPGNTHFADVVAIDGEIVAWLPRHEKAV